MIRHSPADNAFNAAVMSVESPTVSSSSSRPPHLRTARTLSRDESTTPLSGPFARTGSRAIHQPEDSTGGRSSNADYDYGLDEQQHPDLFEKPDSSDSDPGTDNYGDELDKESGGPDQKEELPIELISLTDRYVYATVCAFIADALVGSSTR